MHVAPTSSETCIEMLCVLTLRSEVVNEISPALLGTEVPISPSLSELQVTVSMSEDTSTSEAVATNWTDSPSGPAEPSLGAVMAHRGAEFGGPTSMMTDALSVLPVVSAT